MRHLRNPSKPEPLSEEQLQQFEVMLKSYESAYANYLNMPRSVRRTYAVSYFRGAKTEEGKEKKFNSIIERLELNLNPMKSKKKHRLKNNEAEVAIMITLENITSIEKSEIEEVSKTLDKGDITQLVELLSLK